MRVDEKHSSCGGSRERDIDFMSPAMGDRSSVRCLVDPVIGVMTTTRWLDGCAIEVDSLSACALSFRTSEPVAIGESIQVKLFDNVKKNEIQLSGVVESVTDTYTPESTYLQVVECRPGGGAKRWPRVAKALSQRLAVDKVIYELGNPSIAKVRTSIGADERLKAVQYMPATDIVDREAAYRLVYHSYRKKGLTETSERGMYVNRFLLNPETVTFIGKLEDRVELTVTSIPDSKNRLPMDVIFGDCLEPLRSGGRRLVEFGMLAVNPMLFDPASYTLQDPLKMVSVYSLFRIALQHALFVKGYTDVMFAIPPKHEALYRFMGVSAISDVRYYSKYNTPAICMRIDLKNMNLRNHVRQFLFGQPLLDLSRVEETLWTEDAIGRIFGSNCGDRDALGGASGSVSAFE